MKTLSENGSFQQSLLENIIAIMLENVALSHAMVTPPSFVLRAQYSEGIGSGATWSML